MGIARFPSFDSAEVIEIDFLMLDGTERTLKLSSTPALAAGAALC